MPPKRNNSCYTCNPSKFVLKHIIGRYNETIFHHDMLRRSMLIATPVTHFHNIESMTAKDLYQIFEDIKEFMSEHNINGYQCLFNTGTWQTHHHFHVKILIDENILANMRHAHFQPKVFSPM